MAIRCFCLFSTVLLLASVHPVEASPQAKASPEEAIRLLRQGKTNEAIQLLKQALVSEKDPRRLLPLHGLLGDIYAEQFKTDEAVAQYDAILELEPKASLALLKKGEVLMRHIPSVDKALAAFKRAEELGVKAARLYVNMAFCHKLRGDFSEDLEQKEKHYQDAIKDYRRALVLEPNNSRALGNLGDILFNMGDHERAADTYQKILATQPKNVLILARLGHAQLLMGNHQDAVVTLQNGLELIGGPQEGANLRQRMLAHDREVELRSYLAQAREAAGQKEAARKAWQAVLDVTNRDPGKGNEGMTTRATKNARKLAEERLKALEGK